MLFYILSNLEYGNDHKAILNGYVTTSKAYAARLIERGQYEVCFGVSNEKDGEMLDKYRANMDGTNDIQWNLSGIVERAEQIHF